MLREKMKIIILMAALILNFVVADANDANDANFFNSESDFFNKIVSYSETNNHLNQGEEELLRELRKIPLKVGYEHGNEVEGAALKEIFKRYLDIDLILIKEPWHDLLESLERGEIDIISNLSFTRERTRYIDYTENYYSSKVFLVYPENIDINKGNSLKKKKLIYTEESTYLEAFKHLENEYGVELRPDISPDLKDVKDDTYIVSDRLQIYSITKNGYTHLKYKEFLSSDPVYFGMSRVMSKENRDLLKKLFNTYINKRLRSFLDIYQTYLDDGFEMKLMDDVEIEFLQSQKSIYIGVDKEQYYISHRNEKGRGHRGALIDLIDDHEKLMGKKEILEVNSMKGKAELLNYMPNSVVLLPLNIENSKIYSLSEALYSMEYFLVRDRYVRMENNVVGIASSSYYLEDFLSQVADDNYRVFESSSDMISALETGEVGSVIMSENDIKYFQNEKLKTFLEIHKSIGSIQIGMATNRNNMMLSAVVRKFVKYIFKEDDFMKKWKYTPNLVGIKYKKKVGQLYLLIGVLGLVVVILCITIRKLYLYNYYDSYTGLPNIKLLGRAMKKKENSGLITFSVSNISEILDSFSETEALERFKEIISGFPLPLYYISRNQYAMFSERMTQQELLLYLNRFIKISPDYHLGNIKINFNYGIGHMSTSETPQNMVKNTLYSMHLFEQNKKVIEGDPKVLEEHRAQKKLERKLEEALTKEEYTPYFQAKFDIKTGKVKGAEILSRYIDGKEKFVSPGIFIPILEELNIITRLDLLVLKKSLIIIKGFLDQGVVEKHFVISQNLSIKTLEDEDILVKIKEIIKEVEFPLENLEFEVTETAISQNIERISNNLTKIKSLGVSISLDDFSAGNSSINYINHLPIDIIKIDMSILPRSEDETTSINIFTALSRTFKDLGYEVVAEGVETEWQNEFISNLGIDTGQGYHYSKALDEDLFKVFIEESRGESRVFSQSLSEKAG